MKRNYTRKPYQLSKIILFFSPILLEILDQLLCNEVGFSNKIGVSGTIEWKGGPTYAFRAALCKDSLY